MINKVSERMRGISSRLSLPYLIFFEIVLICRMVSIYSLSPSKIDSLFTLIIMALSAIYFIFKYIPDLLEKKRIKIEYLLIVFMLVLVITTFVNRSYAFTDNLKLIIWQGMFFFCVFEVGRSNNRQDFKIFENTLLFIWTILVTIALYLFFARVSFSTPVESLYYGMRIGFFENRLYGVFVDPNYAATISIVCIFLSVKKWSYVKNIFGKLLSIMIVFLQLSYISLSGSRSGVIQLSAAIFFGVFFLYLYSASNSSRKMLAKVSVAILLSLICSAISVGGISLFKTGYAQLANNIQISTPFIVDGIEKETSKEIPDDVELTTERPDVAENKDISNSRFKLWSSAVDLMKLNPLFGTSPRGFADVAKTRIPKTYIAKTAQSPHSFFFYLLAATGISGTIVFMVFLISKMVKSIRVLFRMNIKDYFQFLIDNQIVLVILVSGLLITEVVLTRRFGTFVFWLYLGKLQSQFDKYEIPR